MTAICLSQLIACIAFSVIVAIAPCKQNLVQHISCDEKIVVAIASCEQPFTECELPFIQKILFFLEGTFIHEIALWCVCCLLLSAPGRRCEKRTIWILMGLLLWMEQLVRLKTVSRHTGKTNNVSCRQFFHAFGEGSSMRELQRRVDRRCQDVTMPGNRPVGLIVYYVFIVFEFFLCLFYLYQSWSFFITCDERMEFSLNESEIQSI